MTTPITVTDADVARVRADIGATELTDPQIAERIATSLDDDGSINHTRATMSIWQTKAGQYADLVDVQEGNSSRAMSDLYKHALEMVKYYQDILLNRAKVELAGSRGRVKIGQIRRAGYNS